MVTFSDRLSRLTREQIEVQSFDIYGHKTSYTYRYERIYLVESKVPKVAFTILGRATVVLILLVFSMTHIEFSKFVIKLILFVNVGMLICLLTICSLSFKIGARCLVLVNFFLYSYVVQVIVILENCCIMTYYFPICQM